MPNLEGAVGSRGYSECPIIATIMRQMSLLNKPYEGVSVLLSARPRSAGYDQSFVEALHRRFPLVFLNSDRMQGFTLTVQE